MLQNAEIWLNDNGIVYKIRELPASCLTMCLQSGWTQCHPRRLKSAQSRCRLCRALTLSRYYFRKWFTESSRLISLSSWLMTLTMTPVLIISKTGRRRCQDEWRGPRRRGGDCCHLMRVPHILIRNHSRRWISPDWGHLTFHTLDQIGIGNYLQSR